MAQSPRDGLYGPPSKRHVGVCAIYSEITVINRSHFVELVPKQVELARLSSLRVELTARRTQWTDGNELRKGSDLGASLE